MDLRPELVAAAGERLAAIGYRPRLAARDGWERFGITAAPDRQHVWFDHPGSSHTWPLDLAGEP